MTDTIAARAVAPRVSIDNRGLEAREGEGLGVVEAVFDEACEIVCKHGLDFGAPHIGTDDAPNQSRYEAIEERPELIVREVGVGCDQIQVIFCAQGLDHVLCTVDQFYLAEIKLSVEMRAQRSGLLAGSAPTFFEQGARPVMTHDVECILKLEVVTPRQYERIKLEEQTIKIEAYTAAVCHHISHPHSN